MNINILDKINKKFEGVTTGDILQTFEVRRDVLETIKVAITAHTIDSAVKNLIDYLENEMLFLSYRYSLWDLYICWCPLPVMYPHPNIMSRQEEFRIEAKLMIYRETSRV
ncbi:hypothetical protein M0R04_16330 [Candidatus Dojkabacteria bacterium]|jgi:hypothetical protein|nr:hypothetical protein [Candidatus Dojkabacteria bacterium]